MTKAPTSTEMSKGQSDNTTTPQKSSIKQRLRTDLGRSVGVTTATKLVWTSLRLYQLFIVVSDLSSLPDGRSTARQIRMSLNIFLIYNINFLCCLCIDFYDLSAWWGCVFVVYIRRFIYKFLNVCHFDYTAVAGSGKSSS